MRAEREGAAVAVDDGGEGDGVAEDGELGVVGGV